MRAVQGLRLSSPLKVQLRRWVLGVFPKGQGSVVDYDEPRGDPGLFGPDSVTWKIHSDFPGMLSGGICALMLQTLHPLALAGVWDHSSFRTDLIGRLRRTTAFVAGTSFAATDEAQRLIARVRVIHKQVQGLAEDGRPYSANDPELLTWVHITEMASFLWGYEVYRGISVPTRLQDRYYRETSQVAEALGAKRVPKSAAAVVAYFKRLQPQLAYTERSAEVLAVLEKMQLPMRDAGLSRNLFLGAANELLPDWARSYFPRSARRQIRARAAKASLIALAPLFRAALTDGVAARACARVGAGKSCLELPPS